jgi:hypothetical protein
MIEDVNKWCEECDFCQRYKKSNTKAELHPIIATAPGQIIGTDIVTFPLRTGDKKKFRSKVQQQKISL